MRGQHHPFISSPERLHNAVEEESRADVSVDCAQRVIQDAQVGVAVDGAREADAGFLPAGDGDPALADFGVVWSGCGSGNGNGSGSGSKEEERVEETIVAGRGSVRGLSVQVSTSPPVDLSTI